MEKINKYGLGSNNKELVVTDKYGNVKSIFQNKITLTTLGSSGPSTFVNNILNIPNYSTALSGYVPTSRQLTINGTTYDLSANRTWDVGTVTSVTASTPLMVLIRFFHHSYIFPFPSIQVSINLN
jgi:hypothetical protein